MIYLLDGNNEFQPILYNTGKIKDIFANFNMSNVIYDKLKTASQKHELIHTQWLRGIGKTYELVCFAKEYGYAVLEPTKIVAEEIRKKENYEGVYSSKTIYSLKGCKANRDVFNKNVVIDEGVTNIQEIKDAGFNIITGFYTPKKEDESTFNEKVLGTLVNEIEALTPKLEKYRVSEDYGTYKNLINAYGEILSLMKEFPQTAINK